MEQSSTMDRRKRHAIKKERRNVVKELGPNLKRESVLQQMESPGKYFMR